MKKIVSIVLIILLLLPSFFLPFLVNAKDAETLSDLKNQLSSLNAEKKAIDSEKSQTKSQINNKKNAIYEAYQEQEENEKKVLEAEELINESNIKIESKNKEINLLLRFLQISNGENAYLEYIAGSESTTDLIMRSAIVEQLTEYNDEVLKELELLIKENEELKQELEIKNQELTVKQNEYQKAISSLGSKLSELNEINEDIDDQISNQKALIKYYESICTSDSQTLSDCIKLASDNRFIRPLVSGRITSPFGYRIDPLTGKAKSFHNAIDIGGNKEGTPVYAAASGTVAAVTKKSSCGGNKVYIHHNINGVMYTTQYVHLLSYKVKVGDTVTNQTIIGYVGGGSKTRSWDKCSTGAHLHFVIAKGHYLGGGPYGYSKWSTYLSKCVNPLNYLPSSSKKWSNRYS